MRVGTRPRIRIRFRLSQCLGFRTRTGAAEIGPTMSARKKVRVGGSKSSCGDLSLVEMGKTR